MTDWTPTAGDRIFVGWRAMRQLLIDNPDGVSWVRLKEASRKSGASLQAKTCQNLIASCVKHGFISKQGGRYSLTGKGRSAS